jgi:hypothetical protein
MEAAWARIFRAFAMGESEWERASRPLQLRWYRMADAGQRIHVGMKRIESIL